MAKQKITITLSAEAKERLLQYGFEKHIAGGLSGVIETLAWKQKVTNEQIRGQLKID